MENWWRYDWMKFVTFSTLIFIYTSLSILNVLLMFLWLPPSFAVLSSSPDHTPLCCTFASLGHTASSIHLYYFISSNLLFDITPCSLFSSTWHLLFPYLSHARYNTTTSLVYQPNSSKHASSGIPLPQCSFALFLNSSTELLFYSCCASHGLATHTASLSSTLLVRCKGTSRVMLSKFWGSVLLMAQWQIVYRTLTIPDFSCLCHVVRCLLLVILGHSVIIGWLPWCCVPDYLV